MKVHRQHVLPVMLGGLAALSLAAPSLTTAGSKEGINPGTHSSVLEIAGADRSASKPASLSSVRQADRKPGPAWKTIGGTLKHIKGDVYTVEDYEGNQVQLYVSRETKQLRGSKKVGDRVRAEITRSGFANSIQ